VTATQWITAACTCALLALSACADNTAGGNQAAGNTPAGSSVGGTAIITGQWTLTIDTPRGIQNPIVEISEVDGVLKGTYQSFRGPLDITEVTLDGNDFSFPLKITVPIGTIEVSYAGTINGDEMTGLVKNPRGEVPFTGIRTGS